MALAQAAWRPLSRRFRGLPRSSHTGSIRLAAASGPGEGTGERPASARAAQALRSRPDRSLPVRLQRGRPHSNARQGAAIALTLLVIPRLPVSPVSREAWLGNDSRKMEFGSPALESTSIPGLFSCCST